MEIEKPPKKSGCRGLFNGYPKSVFFIIGNEFCERFSYYGMRTILTIYLTLQLKLGPDTATAVYHSFVGLCYISPIFGAILADGYIGKYKTILYLSILYAVGNLIMAGTAIPPAEMAGPAVGLLLIGLGTGGIKPCVVAFGGDQFSADQFEARAKFFSVFYFAINAGSLLSTFLTPVLRGDVSCFGGNCFFLAFGVPAVLMIVSLLFFFAGRNLYKKAPPTGNVIGQTFRCVVHAIKKKFSRSSMDIRDHWLDYADDSFDSSFIHDVKSCIRVLCMFLPLPLFWALFDQQGSRWTLQAAKLNGEVRGYRIKPEQLQAINPVFILLMIPIFESAIYPLLNKCRIPNRPLQRMSVGMLFAGLSFIIAGFLQLKIDSTLETPLQAGMSEIKFTNAAPCPIVINTTVAGSVISLPVQKMSSELRVPSDGYSVSVSSNCPDIKEGVSQNIQLADQQSYNVIVGWDSGKLKILQFQDDLEKPNKGQAAISFVSSSIGDVIRIELSGEDSSPDFNVTSFNTTSFAPIEPGRYGIKLTIFDQSGANISTVDLGHVTLHTGGVYTMVIQTLLDKVVSKLYEDVEPNSLSIFLQVPQYVIITMGEVMFSITGLSFAYSQAPGTMKSVLQAAWLLTVAVGNLIVVLVAETQLVAQAAEFFLFAALCGLVTIIFSIMAYFYKYQDVGHREMTDVSDETGLVTNETSENIPMNYDG